MTGCGGWIRQETVAANRSDSLGLSMLREKTSIDIMVISREVNPVVAARCKKLKIPYLQAVNDQSDCITEVI